MRDIDLGRVPAAFVGPLVAGGRNAVAWDGVFSPPLHLNVSALAVAAAVDGQRTVGEIADAAMSALPASPVARRELEVFVHRLVEAFGAYGVLADSDGYSRARLDNAVDHRPTVCARKLFRLDRATLFLVDVGYRPIAVSVADERLSRELAVVLKPFLVDAPVDLASVPLELAVVPSDRTKAQMGTGLHHLYGPDNRTLVRSTDLGDVVSSALRYLGNELAVARHPDDVWFRGTVLERHGTDAFVVSPGLFRIWKTTRRRIESAGYAACPGSNLRVGGNGALLDAPCVDIDDLGVIERCSALSDAGPRQAVASERSWDRIIGLAIQNEGGTEIDDPVSEAAFELAHQAHLLHSSARPPFAWPGGEDRVYRVLHAAWALARAAHVHRSARLDHEFVDALLAEDLVAGSR